MNYTKHLTASQSRLIERQTDNLQNHSLWIFQFVCQ